MIKILKIGGWIIVFVLFFYSCKSSCNTTTKLERERDVLYEKDPKAFHLNLYKEYYAKNGAIGDPTDSIDLEIVEVHRSEILRLQDYSQFDRDAYYLKDLEAEEGKEFYTINYRIKSKNGKKLPELYRKRMLPIYTTDPHGKVRERLIYNKEGAVLVQEQHLLFDDLPSLLHIVDESATSIEKVLIFQLPKGIDSLKLLPFNSQSIYYKKSRYRKEFRISDYDLWIEELPYYVTQKIDLEEINSRDLHIISSYRKALDNDPRPAAQIKLDSILCHLGNRIYSKNSAVLNKEYLEEDKATFWEFMATEQDSLFTNFIGVIEYPRIALGNEGTFHIRLNFWRPNKQYGGNLKPIDAIYWSDESRKALMEKLKPIKSGTKVRFTAKVTTILDDFKLPLESRNCTYYISAIKLLDIEPYSD